MLFNVWMEGSVTVDAVDAEDAREILARALGDWNVNSCQFTAVEDFEGSENDDDDEFA